MKLKFTRKTWYFSQSLTFKSNDTKVATVSAKGVITAVGMPFLRAGGTI